MRVLVPVFIVAIIAVTVVVLVLADRRKTKRREDFAKINHDLHRARGTLTRLSGELELQMMAGHTDLSILEGILREHNKYTYGEDRL